jgi:hypothetical protein
MQLAQKATSALDVTTGPRIAPQTPIQSDIKTSTPQIASIAPKQGGFGATIKQNLSNASADLTRGYVLNDPRSTPEQLQKASDSFTRQADRMQSPLLKFGTALTEGTATSVDFVIDAVLIGAKPSMFAQTKTPGIGTLSTFVNLATNKLRTKTKEEKELDQKWLAYVEKNVDKLPTQKLKEATQAINNWNHYDADPDWDNKPISKQIMENPARVVYQAGPELAANIVPFLVSKNPAMLLMLGQGGDSMKEDALQAGVPLEYANIAGLAFGGVMAGLERLGARFFRGNPAKDRIQQTIFRKLADRALKTGTAGVGEGGTELTETVFEKLINSTYREVTGEEWKESLVGAGFLGTIGGAGTRGIFESYNAARDIIEKVDTRNMPAGLSVQDVSRGTTLDNVTISIQQAKASGQSFDEWVKGQGETLYHGSKADIVGDLVPGASGSRGSAIYITPDKTQASKYGKINEVVIDKKAKVFDLQKGNEALKKDIVSYLEKNNIKYEDVDGFIFSDVGNIDLGYSVSKERFNKFLESAGKDKFFKDLGYDIAKFGEGETQVSVYNPKVIKTRSQLKAEWDGAQVPTKTQQMPQRATQEVSEGIGEQVIETGQRQMFTGANKVVAEKQIDLEGKSVIQLEGDQRSLLGVQTYPEADQILIDRYGDDFDFVKITHPELPNKADEYLDLSEARWYSPDKTTAQTYALQSRSAKYDEDIAKPPLTPSQKADLEYRRQQEIEDRSQKEIQEESEIINARESTLEFVDSEKEFGYQEYKDLARRSKQVQEIEDYAQLRYFLVNSKASYAKQFQTGEDVDNALFSGSGDISNDSLLDMFKSRRSEEMNLVDIGRGKTPRERADLTKRAAEIIVKQSQKGKPLSIAEALRRPSAPIIKKRETTLLKDKIRNLARGAREGTNAERAYQKAVTALKMEEQKGRLARKSELDKLRQRVNDRERFVTQGKREGATLTRDEISTRLKQINELIRESDLSLRDKGKFAFTQAQLAGIKSEGAFEKQVDSIIERISNLETAAERRGLISDIREMLTNTKPTKTGKYPRGKYTADEQRILDASREVISLTKDEAKQKIVENLTKYKDNMPFEIALQNRVLSMGSGSNADLSLLSKDISAIIEGGKVSAELQNFNRQSEIEIKKDVVLDVLTGGKDIDINTIKNRRQKVKSYFASIGNRYVLSWRGLMEALGTYSKVGDRRLENEFDLVDPENKFKDLQSKFVSTFNDIISSSYNLEAKTDIGRTFAISTKVNELNKPIVYGEFVFGDGKTRTLELTRDQAIKRYMEFQDETLNESFVEGNMYTPEIMSAIEKSLTKQDKVFAEKQLEMYREQYNIVNEVYRKTRGVDLPFNEFYSPIRRKGFQVDTLSQFGEFLDEASFMPGVGGASLNARVGSILPIQAQGGTQVMVRHFAETNYYVAWSETIRDFSAVFGSPEVSSLMEYQFGKPMVRAVNRQIQQVASKGKAYGESENYLDWFREKYTIGALMIKPAIFVKQLTSIFAYTEKLSVFDFTAGMVDFMRNPIENARMLDKESTFIRERINYKERDITAALNSETYKAWSKKQTFFNTLMMNVSLGDKAPVLVGSWAMRRKMLKQGMPLEKVINEYTNFGQETQQSSDTSRLSGIQTEGSFAKLFTMFLSTPRAYYQKEVNAVRSVLRQGGTSPKNLAQVARIITIYHVVLPLVFAAVSQGFRTDDEAMDEYKRSMMLGSFNGLFIAGGVIDSVIRATLGMKVWDQEIPILTVIRDINKMVQAINPDDITLSDMDLLLRGFAGASQSLGIPSESALGLYDGVQKILREDEKEGILNIMGWSDHALGVDAMKPISYFTKQKSRLKEQYKNQVRDGLIPPEVASSKYNEEATKINTEALKDFKEKRLPNLNKERAKEELKEMVQEKLISADVASQTYNAFAEKYDKKEAFVRESQELATESKERGIFRRAEEENIISLVQRTAVSMKADPVTTFRAIFSDEKINLTDGQRVALARIPLTESEEIKKELAGKGIDLAEYKLDHTVPLAFGGTNSMNNLKLISNEDHERNTPIEMFLMSAVENNKVSAFNARRLIKRFKENKITEEEVREEVGN